MSEPSGVAEFVYTPSWIDLDGLVNLRDVGGLPTCDGHWIASRRLLRSDNLQDLTPESVRWLVEEAGVTDVVDLRTDRERRLEGPGPLTRTAVRFHPLSLLPDESSTADALLADDEHEVARPSDRPGRIVSDYLRFLTRRPESAVAGLRVIGHAPGAVLVHCAAGKDRTGTLVALALTLAGVAPEYVADDYAASDERVPAIMAKLRRSRTYADDLVGKTAADQSTPPEAMIGLLAAIDATFGGVEGYLDSHGWTPADTEAVRDHLVA